MLSTDKFFEFLSIRNKETVPKNSKGKVMVIQEIGLL